MLKNALRRIMKLSFCIICLSLFVFATLVWYEHRLERFNERDWEQRNAENGKPYRHSFYTTEGELIGILKGRLKLSYHPVLVYVNQPNQNERDFHINSLGIRGEEIRPKSPGVKRILVLGGSSAFGTGLGSDEETFPRQLERLLPSTEVLNAGVIGYRSGQDLISYLKQWRALKPDLVIDFAGWNDYVAIQEDNFSELSDFNLADMPNMKFSLLHKLVYRDIFSRLKNSYLNMFHLTFARIKSNYAPSGTAKKSDNEIKTNLETAITRFSSNMFDLSQIVRQSGSKFICVLQPISMDKKNSGYAVFRKETKEQLEAQGVLVIDVEQSLKEMDDSLFMDEVHLNADGNRLIAEWLKKEINNL